MMKINGETTTAKEFAFDGCHKIYLIESEDDRADARGCGYDILPISSLREAFNNSCGLQFISNWKLTKSFVNQFGEACFEA
jgi:hypothetical protein